MGAYAVPHRLRKGGRSIDRQVLWPYSHQYRSFPTPARYWLKVILASPLYTGFQIINAKTLSMFHRFIADSRIHTVWYSVSCFPRCLPSDPIPQTYPLIFIHPFPQLFLLLIPIHHSLSSNRILLVAFNGYALHSVCHHLSFIPSYFIEFPIIPSDGFILQIPFHHAFNRIPSRQYPMRQFHTTIKLCMRPRNYFTKKNRPSASRSHTALRSKASRWASRLWPRSFRADLRRLTVK